MKNDAKNMNRWFWVIVLLTILTRSALFVYYKPWTPSYDLRMVGEDPYLYHRLAIDLLATGDYGGNPEYDPNFHTATVRPPGYPILVAVIYALFGARPWVVLMFHILLSTLCTVLIFAITKRFFGGKSAIVAGALFAFHPIAAFTAVTMYTETLFIFLVCLLIYLMMRAYHRAQGDSLLFTGLLWLLVGIVAGYSTVVRVSMLYLAPLLIAVWVVAQPVTFRLRAVSLLVALIGFTLPLIPWSWSMYNYHRFGTARLSASGEYNLLVLTIGQAFAKGGLEEYGRIRQEFIPIAWEWMRRDGLNPQTQPLHRAKYYREVAIEKALENPYVVLQGFLRGAVKFWIVPSRASGEDFVGSAKGFTRMLFMGIFAYAIVIQVLLLLSAVHGLRMLWQTRNWLWVTTFLLTAGYFTLSSGAAGSSRFFLQVLPFLLPVSGYGIANLLQRKSLSPQEGSR